MSSESTLSEAKQLLATLASFPQYAAYVRSHQLKLIDERLAVYDEMLVCGEIQL